MLTNAAIVLDSGDERRGYFLASDDERFVWQSCGLAGAESSLDEAKMCCDSILEKVAEVVP
jgi:hypothetical protein